MAMTAVVSEKARPFVLSAVSCRVLCASRSAPWSAPRPTSVRAEELLGLVRERVNVGDQLIGVIRKGTRALQWVPASPDAFVWLRRYQLQMHGLVPACAAMSSASRSTHDGNDSPGAGFALSAVPRQPR